MSWFKDHQRVLVYHPGQGGEYICCKLNEEKHKENDINRYNTINGFPGQDYLYKQAERLEKLDWEWSEECRLTFNSEQHLKNELQNSNPDFKFLGGNPDRNLPRLGRRNYAKSSDWFPTHWDYGIFRKPVFQWLDCDNDEWIHHWAVCIQMKDDRSTIVRPEDTVKTYRLYREYYSSRYPDSRLSVDDQDFRQKTGYMDWAKRNIELLDANTKPIQQFELDKFRNLPS